MTAKEALVARRSPQFSLGCLLQVTTAICVLLASSIAFIRFASDEYVLHTIDCGRGRSIVITAARSWEINQPVYYLVYEGGEKIVPTTVITYGGAGNADALKFGVHFAANGEVVGVFACSHPSKYLVVHDFRDNASWPRGEFDPTYRKSGRYTQMDLEALLRGSLFKTSPDEN